MDEAAVVIYVELVRTSTRCMWMEDFIEHKDEIKYNRSTDLNW